MRVGSWSDICSSIYDIICVCSSIFKSVFLRQLLTYLECANEIFLDGSSAANLTFVTGTDSCCDKNCTICAPDSHLFNSLLFNLLFQIATSFKSLLHWCFISLQHLCPGLPTYSIHSYSIYCFKSLHHSNRYCIGVSYHYSISASYPIIQSKGYSMFLNHH